MFHTHASAEMFIPPALAPNGQRGWYWLELPIQVPYFLLSFSMDIEGGALNRNFLFSRLDDVLGLLSEMGDSISNVKLSLMSPGYMNGSDTYQLDCVQEIWKCESNQLMFVLADGSKLYTSFDDDGVNGRETELILSF